MKETFLAKLFARVVAGINGTQFNQIIQWVVDADSDPRYIEGYDKAKRVLEQYNANFAEKASWVVKTVIQICYFIVRSRAAKLKP